VNVCVYRRDNIITRKPYVAKLHSLINIVNYILLSLYSDLTRSKVYYIKPVHVQKNNVWSLIVYWFDVGHRTRKTFDIL